MEYYLIDPQTYDDQFWWKKDDIEFWKSLFIYPDTNILELAAGTGRLAVPLIREGINYTGLELSNEYVQYANLKFQFSDPIILGDMRDFNLNKKYDFIFIGFNSFLHLLSKNEAIQCLRSIKNHMHSNSKLYIDIFMPDASSLYRSSSDILTVMEFMDSQQKCTSTIEEFFCYDNKREVASINWQYKNQENIYYKKFDFQMKIYPSNTMNRILVDNGFDVYNLWGSYDRSPLEEGSLLQIYELGI